ncbi:PAS domain-containing protein [soil metagenome]
MKHPSNRQFYAYWDDKRGEALAPDRSEVEPGALRELLADIFVLSYEAAGRHAVRVAGTRICAVLGRDLKGEEFTSLFAPASRREIEDILTIVAEEHLPTVAGITATANGAPAHLELLLLPFRAKAHTPRSLTGLLAPLGGARSGVLGELHLTSWRTMNHPPRRFVARALRKLSVARGLMVYEGLR